MDFERDFVFVGDELQEHVEFGFFEALGDEAAEKLLQFEGIFVCGLFTIYEIV